MPERRRFRVLTLRGALAAAGLESERKRLRALGCQNPERLARPVWHEPARGYDILSQEPDGSPRHIEVKAARSAGGRLSFFLTENERAKARSLPNYHFYLVLNVESTSPAVRVLKAGQVTPDCLSPVTYMAAMGLAGT